ncbi:glycosyltransferase family 2 protein [Luteimonas yindakuii]|uniref:glycosyltransferase family 2 protein n=1 Tax=Luteimonas yindakuii TaxID=2565782 RepID=UPI0010A5591C|nr:glycosyltransferase family 2 protein [Luteimonas yindakuii]QCO66838.1 glycosyltransferase family 2 protein [Luteimonas yindakuii]
MSPPHPWLSVLVPFYRVEPYLRECVESVLAQVDGGVEIVLLDDASPDDCGTIARELRKSHGEVIRLLGHDRNRGIAEARNTLLADARGDYVWFLDSDDLMLPGAIAGLKAAIERTGADLVLCDFRIVRERMALKHRLRGEYHRSTFSGRDNQLESDRGVLLRGLMAARQLHPWSKIARRSCWGTAPFPPRRVVMEDMAAIPTLVANVRTFVHVAEPWIGYRQRPGSALATLDAGKFRDVLASVRELHGAFADDPGLDARTRFAIDYFCIRALSSVAHRITGEQPALARELRDTLQRLFPGGLRVILEECRRRGWWLRRRRISKGIERLERLA